jgi:hypothetical protein
MIVPGSQELRQQGPSRGGRPTVVVVRPARPAGMCELHRVVPRIAAQDQLIVPISIRKTW